MHVVLFVRCVSISDCQVDNEEKPEAGMRDVKRKQAKFKVLGMSCASCVSKIEKYMAGRTGNHMFMQLLLPVYVCMYILYTCTASIDVTIIIAGVHSVHVALLSEMATVEFDELITTSDALTADISSLGFDVECVAVSGSSDFSKANFKVNVAHTLHLFVAQFLCTSLNIQGLLTLGAHVQ